MDHAKKMTLIEPRVLEMLQQRHLPHHLMDPDVKALGALDEKMHDVMNESDLSEEERVKLHNQNLRRYLVYHARETEKPVLVKNVKRDQSSLSPTEDEHLDVVEKDILESVPQTMKTRAKRLVNKIKTSNRIGWNERGELVLDDQTLPNTNMVDLVNDVLRRRKTFEPRGWRTFTRALQEENVPQDLIGHKERWEWMQGEPSAISRSENVSESRPKPRRRVISTAAKKRFRWVPY